MVSKVEPSPLVIAADQLAQAAELAAKRFCGCQSSSDDNWHSEHCYIPALRNALVAYRKVREGK